MSGFFFILGLIIFVYFAYLLKFSSLKVDYSFYIYFAISIFLIFYGLSYKNILYFFSDKNYGKFFLILLKILDYSIILFVITFICVCIIAMCYSFLIPCKKHDAIIILGAGLKGSVISSVLRDRLDKGLEYYNNHKKCVFVVSGGKGADEEVSEAFAMKEYLVSKVTTEQIILEDKSSNTYENLKNSKVLLNNYFDGNHSVLIVSSDFHLLRSSFIAKDFGFNFECLGSKTGYLFLPKYLFREFLSVCLYFYYKWAK